MTTSEMRVFDFKIEAVCENPPHSGTDKYNFKREVGVTELNLNKSPNVCNKFDGVFRGILPSLSAPTS